MVLLLILTFVLKRNRVRPARLRGRRQRRGLAPGRHQRHPDPDPGVRAVVGDGGGQRHRGGVPARLGRPGAGGGNTLLYAVAAAVIGGTSLFGGRGRVRDAVLGGLVIAIIANGLGLLGVAAYLNYIITGAVLLLAASVDALARRRAAATGH